jgi:hypothetical protein
VEKKVEKVYLLPNNVVSYVPTKECALPTYISNFPGTQEELKAIWEQQSKKKWHEHRIKEAAEKYKYNPKGDFCFTKGAKWQSERMYSEEDLRKAFENGVGSGKYQQEYGIKGSMNFEDWFEQFKKK